MLLLNTLIYCLLSLLITITIYHLGCYLVGMTQPKGSAAQMAFKRQSLICKNLIILLGLALLVTNIVNIYLDFDYFLDVQ